MSTAIGLVGKEQPLPVLTAKSEAVGCALDKIKILSQPGEVQTLLEERAFTKCDTSACLRQDFGVSSVERSGGDFSHPEPVEG